ncbi:MAG: hypothetical protein HZA48_08645 [Planctomycetes bacterium]|nr:hypothetical protein [Planctomycetota bacterium]
MKKLTAILIFASALFTAMPAFAQENELRRVEIIFKDETALNAYVLFFDTSGIKVKSDNDVVIFYPWTTIKNDSELKRTLGLLSPDILLSEKEITQNLQFVEQAGISISLKDGRIYNGREMYELSDMDNIVIKSKGKLIKLSRHDIVKREDVLVPLKEIDSEDEIYTLIVKDRIIATADDHYETARMCNRLGLDRKAEFHDWMYELIRRGELPSSAPYKKLLALYNKTLDEQLKDVLYMTGKDILNFNYKDSIDRLEIFTRAHSAQMPLDEIENLLKELKILNQMNMEAQIVNYWYLTGESLVRSKAFDRNAGFNTARKYIELEITNEILNSISQKFSTGKETAKSIWIKRETTVFLTASYGEGTWAKEAPQIKDAEKWWQNSSNAVRFQFLKAYYAETAMQAINVFHKDCPACGNTGKLFGPNGNEFVVCGTCGGLGTNRVVSYR